MNELVCVGINNLTATDGTPGVTWTQVVRHALEQDSAAAARDAILDADLAGGHNFLVFDAEGDGYNIEAMPTARPVTTLAGCGGAHQPPLAPETTAVQGPRAARSGQFDASSRHRRQWLDRDGITADDLMALTREPDAVCQTAVEPYHVESSGRR